MLDARDDVWYGTENVPVKGWSQVVTWPDGRVKIPGGAMSSLSQTVKLPLIAAYYRTRGLSISASKKYFTYVSDSVVSATSVVYALVTNAAMSMVQTHISS